MNFSSKAAPKQLAKTPLLVLFVPEGGKLAVPAGVNLPKGFVSGFEGKLRATASTYVGAPAERVLLIGLGPAKCIDAECLRRVAAIAVKQGEALGAAKVTLWAAGALGHPECDDASAGRALAEGALLGAYGFTEQKSKAPAPKCKATELCGGSAAVRKGAAKGAALAAANAFARDLQNRPGNVATPNHLAAEARKLARQGERVTCKVIDEKAMEALGMGLLLSVSQGSSEPARLIHLTYKPKGKSKGKICLVGKGLTFDAGGISIKPASKMDEMRFDMSGGAAVLGVFHALTKLDVGVEVHGLVPASENLLGASATKPGDIHAAMDGTTVEILNTDAEGRLILADALCYAKSKIKPDTTIDLATLTGAVIVALGHELTAIYPSTDALRDALCAAGRATGEQVWPMPLQQVHRDAMKGTNADLTNLSSPAIGAGSVTAAAFLRHFVPDETAWCHLDIAGTAWNTAQRDWVGGSGGSGVGTRLLFEYLESRS